MSQIFMPDTLINKTEQNYGGNYKDHLFEQYKIYLHDIEKSNDRRINTNNYFLVLNIVFMSFLGFMSKRTELINSTFYVVVLSSIGIMLCIIWYFLICTFKQLNVGKFKVLHEVEENLPLSLYKYEWKVLGEGKNALRYLQFAIIESYIPWAFELVYLVLLITSL